VPYISMAGVTKPQTLNVAGNRESKNKGIENYVEVFLTNTLSRYSRGV